MSGLKSPPLVTLAILPRELYLNIFTFLRATDLSALQRTSRCFNNRDLIAEVIDHCAHVVYPSELTEGFDTPIVSGEVTSIAVASSADTVAFFATKKATKKGMIKQKTHNGVTQTTTATTHPLSPPPPHTHTGGREGIYL